MSVIDNLTSMLGNRTLMVEDLKEVVTWAPKVWDLKTLDKQNETFLEVLMAGADSRNVTQQKMLIEEVMMPWCAEFNHEMTKKTWALVMKSSAGLDCFKEQFDKTDFKKKFLRYWDSFAPENAWQEFGESIIMKAFEEVRWDLIDLAFERSGADPNKIAVKWNFYPYNSNKKLGASLPDVAAYEIFKKHGGVLEPEDFDELSSSREEAFTDNTSRRILLQKVRQDIQSDSKFKQYIFWSTIKNAKSWMDIQKGLNDVGEDVKTMRGPRGENVLMYLLAEQPDYVFNLNRSKAFDKGWWAEKDKNGLDWSHYYASSGRYNIRDESKKIINENPTKNPQTLGEACEWLKAFWTLNTKETDSLWPKNESLEWVFNGQLLGDLSNHLSTKKGLIWAFENGAQDVFDKKNVMRIESFFQSMRMNYTSTPTLYMKDIYEELTPDDPLEIKKHVFGVLVADIKSGLVELENRHRYDSDKEGVQKSIERYQKKAQEWMVKLGEKLSQTNTTMEDLKGELEKREIANTGDLISIVEHSFLTKVAKNEVGSDNQIKRKARVL